MQFLTVFYIRYKIFVFASQQFIGSVLLEFFVKLERYAYLNEHRNKQSKNVSTTTVSFSFSFPIQIIIMGVFKWHLLELSFYRYLHLKCGIVHHQSRLLWYQLSQACFCFWNEKKKNTKKYRKESVSLLNYTVTVKLCFLLSTYHESYYYFLCHRKSLCPKVMVIYSQAHVHNETIIKGKIIHSLVQFTHLANAFLNFTSNVSSTIRLFISNKIMVVRM